MGGGSDHLLRISEASPGAGPPAARALLVERDSPHGDGPRGARGRDRLRAVSGCPRLRRRRTKGQGPAGVGPAGWRTRRDGRRVGHRVEAMGGPGIHPAALTYVGLLTLSSLEVGTPPPSVRRTTGAARRAGIRGGIDSDRV